MDAYMEHNIHGICFFISTPTDYYPYSFMMEEGKN